MKPKEAIERLKLKFTSANDIPVSRAVITREEFEAIEKVIDYSEIDGYNQAIDDVLKILKK